MTEMARRQFLKYSAGAGVALHFPWQFQSGSALAAIPGGSLDPTTIDKFLTPLVIPPAMPLTTTIKHNTIDYYVIAVVQFLQQILPANLPKTRVWSYQLRNDKGTRNYPAFSIEALAGRPVRVKWINGLVDEAGNYLPHILPIDPTLHWANPPGGVTGRDSHPIFTTTPGRYTGPVPIVTHHMAGTTPRRATVTPRLGTCPPPTISPQASPQWGRSTMSLRPSSRPRPARCGIPGQPCSSTRTTSRRRRCGSMTTRWE
jgi:spore coat protein A